MRAVLKSVLIALAIATPLHAAENNPEVPNEPEAAVVVETAPAEAVEAAPTAPEMQLDPVQVEQRASADEAVAAQLPNRGSFWWLVAVVVVAGVILAVLL